MAAGRSVEVQLREAKSAARRGDLSQARSVYDAILTRYPGNRKAQSGLAQLLRTDGSKPLRKPVFDPIQPLYTLYHKKDYAQALEGAETLLAEDPLHKAGRDLKAACLRMLARPEEALVIYRSRLEDDAEDAELWQKCGGTLMEMLRLKEAEQCLQMATRLSPDTVYNWMALTTCYQRQGDNPNAYHALTQALGRDPENISALDLLGQILRDMGKTEMALSAHEQALELAKRPEERSRIRTNIGVIKSAMGDRASARVSYLAALSEQRDNVHALLNLTTLSNPEDTADLTRRARKLLRQERTSLTDRSKINFALFRLLDRADSDPGEAFGYLETGNAQRRELIHYTPRNQKALFGAIRTLSDGAPELGAAAPGVRPIFIVGLPRSGTTLTEQMLAAAPGVHAAGELTMVERLSLDLMRRLESENRTAPSQGDMQGFAHALRQALTSVAGTAPVVLDKMPLNFRWVGLMLAALPDARVIHVHRDPVEVCWSNFTTSFSSHGNGFAYALEDLVEYHRMYSDLTAHWTDRYPARFRTVHYEDLVQAPEPTLRDVVDWCGLDWSDGCLHPEDVGRAVLTASVHQVRKAIYNGNQRRWQRYTPFIGTLLEGFDAANAA